MREITYREAVSEALFNELKRDETVFLMGEDLQVFSRNLSHSISFI